MPLEESFFHNALSLDVRGRQEILELYLQDKPLAEDVDVKAIARGTPGLNGTAMDFTIGVSILGQVIGSRAEKHRLKALAAEATVLVKTLCPQPLPAKMLVIAMLGMAANVPLGIWREHTKKFSPSWFVTVHAAVSFIAMLRKSVLVPKRVMAFTIGAFILGQVIGS